MRGSECAVWFQIQHAIDSSDQSTFKSGIGSRLIYHHPKDLEARLQPEQAMDDVLLLIFIHYSPCGAGAFD